MTFDTSAPSTRLHLAPVTRPAVVDTTPMLLNLFEPDSEQWWLYRLLTKFREKPRRPKLQLADSRRYDYTYYDWRELLWSYRVGEPPLSGLASQWADATREFIRLSKSNYAGVVVEALMNRVQFWGVRVPGDTDGDSYVRQFIVENGAFVQDAEDYAFTMGAGYLLVGPPANPGEPAIASAEDPRSTMVITDPARPRVVLAGLKTYWDDVAGAQVAAMYLRGGVGGDRRDRLVTFYSQTRFTDGVGSVVGDWELQPDLSGPLPVQGLGVPIVPLVNPRGRGEFEEKIDLLDRIINGIADRLWTAKYQVHMQRGIRSDNLPDYDSDGKKIDYNDIFRADPGALWKLPLDAEIWESKQISVDAILAPVRDDLKELSATTSTPLHMFSPDAMTGSAEGASLSREGISFKADDRTQRWSPDMIRLARLGLAYGGQQPAGPELEAIWAPTERLSLSARVTAGAAAGVLGLPSEGLWADLMQVSPSVVARWKALIEQGAPITQTGANAAVSSEES